MTLGEAIKHCLEVAEQNDAQAEKWREEGGEEWGKTTACRECAADHRQLAEWLTELKELREENKEAKRLLKAAVEDMNEKNFCVKACKRDNFACRVSDTCDFKWRYADEALEIIKGGKQK